MRSPSAFPRGARVIGLLAAAVLALGPGALVAAAPTAIPVAPTRFASDEAGFLSEATRAELDERLAQFEKESGHQVLLWVGHTSGGVPIEDWAARAFAAWRVGRKGLDDGVVLFVMADDRKLRIEVGYGLEASLPDARAAQIIRDDIVPRLAAGDRDGAVRAGIDGILSALGGSGPAAQPVAHGPVPRLGWGAMLVLGLLAVAFLGFLITHPGAALLLLTTINGGGANRGGGGWGRGGGGFGGFSGGGGRSGGGGASGSW